ncbi:MAG TPA: twin-arginine translocase subunit TatC, partial [Gemmatimonadales bacterium]|nr:twin-arginine translocase subunit TatC [Gemmatimonadales bacterium]
MTGPAGEMPFLDHLEELRRRILWSLVAIVLGCLVGFWVVQHFQLVNLLKDPIAPYLANGGKLTVLSPTEPVMIVLELSLVTGLVLASPIVLWQIWAFLSPGLYEKEKRALVPALFVGLVLFLTGAILAYVFLLPQALRVLFSFQTEAIAPMITYDAYFSFVVQLCLSLGISFELPLVIIILAALGIVTPSMLGRFRRVAIVLACIAGAFLSPGTDILSMALMTAPLILLYEIGYLGAVIVHRRRARRAAAGAVVLLVLMLSGGRRAEAQVPFQVPQADSGRNHLGAITAGAPLDSATASQLGIPTKPTYEFASPDSAMQSLLTRSGYDVTRYRADSATLYAEEKRVVLDREGMVKREDIVLQADHIGYQQASCGMSAEGKPYLFNGDQVLVGTAIDYDTCKRRGIIRGALTNFQEANAVWFLRGDVANDSSSSRLYAASSAITSCNLPEPHYHFAAREVKWVSQHILVARPVVLYIRDVPILWLPFIFQDARPGRHSGILVPQFGINDIVRTSHSYNRQISNLGYYWAPNDYVDLTGRLDWYANRYVQYSLDGSYRWLNRFMNGSIGFSRQHETGGGSSTGFHWTHQQQFNLSTSLNFNINYATNSTVLDRNAIDPRLNTQQITSSLNFTKRFNWGSLAIGGSRRQGLSGNVGTSQTFPTLTISPKPLALSNDITWSPGLSFTNDVTSNTPLSPLVVARPGGGLDTLQQTGSSRRSAFNLDTPFRFGSFQWTNSVSLLDQRDDSRRTFAFREPDLTTPDPNDSVTVNRVYPGSFSTGVDWNTGINLPILFRGSWKLQPTVGITNAMTGQPFAVRNQFTGGAWVLQGKRLQLGATLSPTFFGFFPGLGPISRIRHSISPIITWRYSPSARVSEDFARAVTAPGQPLKLRSDPVQQLAISLSQSFEAKGRPQPGDTLGLASPNIRKYRLLSISTSQFAYDFEQAKLPGRTGWVTPSISNTILSDLLPGFNLTLTHDLWRGAVGSDTAQFDPFLSSVNANFSISANTFRAIGSIFGLGGGPHGETTPAQRPVTDRSVARDFQNRGNRFFNTEQMPVPGGRFTANFNYTLSRTRPIPGAPPGTTTDRQNLGFTTSFSPTR